MGEMTERRSTRRYDLSLPIIIRMPERKTDSQCGKTLDISTRGLYFVLDDNLESGSVAKSEPRCDVPGTADIQINEECPQALSSSSV